MGNPITVKVGGIAYNNVGWSSGEQFKTDTATTNFAILRHKFIVSPQASNVEARVYCSDTCNIEHIIIRALPTKSRVDIQQNIDRSVTPEKVFTTSYDYDEGATNDADHSASATTLVPYIQKWTEFRGYGMVRETGPDGKSMMTWYYQDDVLKGRPSMSIVGMDTKFEPFHSLNTDSDWTAAQATGIITTTRITGDPALYVYNPAANYDVQISRQVESISSTSPITNSITLQFRPSGAEVMSVIGLESGVSSTAEYRRFGVWLSKENGSHVLRARYYNSTGFHDQVILNSASGLVLDQWYVLHIVLDQTKFNLTVWQAKNPDVYAYFELDPVANNMTSKTWRFKSYVYNGTVWLDSYREGMVFSRTRYVYTSKNSVALGRGFGPPRKNDVSSSRYTGLEIYWSALDRQINYTYEGNASWDAVQQKFEYDGYGNLISRIDSKWDFAGHYDDYRITRWGYYPTARTSVKYLVGLPAYETLFDCTDTSINGTCSLGPRLATVLYLYDGNTIYDAVPAQGIMTGQRTQLTDLTYSDLRFGYDAWGNQTTVTTYTAENAYSAFGAGTAQVTTTEYDTTYHTYPIKTTNARGHVE